jgi:hypothetical protein
MRTVSALGHLVRDGILQRSSGRLRVSSRFVAQAELAAAQRALRGDFDLHAAFESALRACGYGGSIPTAARYLRDFMAERGQLGVLQPVFRAPAVHA